MKGIAVLAAVAASAALVIPGTSSGQSSALPTLEVAVGGGSIAVSGAPQSGAATVRATNSGEEPATITLVRLHAGVTADELREALPAAAEDPNLVHDYGSIRYDASAAPGVSAVDTVLHAGDYVAFDSSGRNPAQWPSAEFTVGQAASEAALPAAAATIRAVDFGFRGPKRVERGSVVRFRQDGFTAHMIVALRVQNPFVARRLMRLLKAGKDGQAEKLARGFASFMDPASRGAVHQSELTAQAGTYVLACFLGTQDGRAHTRLGMVRQLRVKK